MISDLPTLDSFDSLITEADVCERFPHLVGPKELRAARKKGDIAFVSGKGIILYHPDGRDGGLYPPFGPIRQREFMTGSRARYGHGASYIARNRSLGGIEPVTPTTSTYSIPWYSRV
jgi:hypothetical protein